MHPLQRILVSLAAAAIGFFLTRGEQANWKITAMILWDLFAATFLLTGWIVLFTRPVPAIIKQANKDDGSTLFVMMSILVTCFASMLLVLLMVISKDDGNQSLIIVLLGVIGMLVSWAMVHTIFTFHYAHLYYKIRKDDTPTTEALVFPGQKKPDYLDFAYFAFVIGMTFQVSDVTINSPKLRRIALGHGLLSFALNTFVIAVTINMIAGLKQ